MTPQIALTRSPSARLIGGEAGQFSVVKRLTQLLPFLFASPQPAVDDRSALTRLLDEIESYRVAENEDDYIVRSTFTASRLARVSVTVAYRMLADEFPTPTVEPDGEGGLVLDWRNNGKILRLACRAHRTQQDYIYHQFGDEHKATAFTIGGLIARLRWLIK